MITPDDLQNRIVTPPDLVNRETTIDVVEHGERMPPCPKFDVNELPAPGPTESDVEDS